MEEGEETKRRLSSLPVSVQPIIEDWLSYKSERRESYKPTGLKSFLAQVEKAITYHGAEAVRESIEQSMANNWRGWDHGLKDRDANRRNGSHRNGSTRSERIAQEIEKFSTGGRL